MKKIIAILVLIFIIGSMLMGCNTVDPDSDSNKKPGGSSDSSVHDPDPDPIYTIGTKVGNLFGDLSLETLDGGRVNTADYRGKILILNIWATRCPPCKEELPDFNKIASEYEGEVVIIAAHEDYTRSAAPSYVETNFPNSKIIFAYDTPQGNAYYAAGGDRYIPQTAIINKEGVIIYSDSGILSYEDVVAIIEGAK